MSSVFQTKALILRHTAEREFDRLLTVITPALGQQRFRARGTKKSTSKLGGSLEPLTEVDLMVANGRVVDVITGSVIHDRFPKLRSDIMSLVAAQWWMELIEQVTRPNEADEELYAMSIAMLHEMEQEVSMPAGQRWLRLCRRAWFILRHQGFSPSVTRCSGCQGELPLADVRFHPLRGFMHLAEAPPDATLVSASTLGYLRGLEATNQRLTFREVHRLLEQVLHHSIDRPLRSEQVLRSIVKLERLSVR